MEVYFNIFIGEFHVFEFMEVSIPKNFSKMCAIIISIGLLATLPSSLILADPSDDITRTYLLGTGILCGLPEPDPCPDIAMADNGDTIEITGSGTFSIHPKTVTGSGDFVHKNSAGTVLGSGTWAATKLLSFTSYGTSTFDGVTIEGGKLVMRVHFIAASGIELDGILQVDCLVGSPPAGAVEGVRLNVQGLINFNKEVSGLTVYIQP